jgi:4-amino-4-deoxy-L-arabinose transferase-like glycosyltransferase
MDLTAGYSETHRTNAATSTRVLRMRWETVGLVAIAVLAACLNLAGLNRLGYGNTYYAAAVRSMLQNWHNFFFVSFDPGGFVTVDKPALGYWVQTASAKVFGFHGWSILLPQALAGIGSVVVVYFIVRGPFGAVAGLIAALAMALTPVAIADNRNNTVDSMLVFVLLLAAWAVLRATEKGSLRWLLLGMALVGAGFNVKMLEAYLALPAMLAVYFLCAPLAWRTRFWHLAAGALVLVAVSLSWAVAVDMTPATQRPYVGSSRTNSEIELAFGYNGLQRLTGLRFPGRPGGNPGQARRTGAGAPGSPNQAAAGDARSSPAAGAAIANPPARTAPVPGAGGTNQPGFAPPPGGDGANQPGFAPPPGGGGPGFVEGGASPLRLIGRQLGGQAAWLLPFALLGLLAIVVEPRHLRPLNLRRLLQWHPDSKLQQATLWGVWLAGVGGFFSVAGFFHPYYLVTLAPPIAALTGAGAVVMWQGVRGRGWRAWLLPVALLLTAGVQVYMLRDYPQWSGRLTLIIAGASLLGALFIAARNLLPKVPVRAVAVASAIAIAGLFVVPAVWSGLTVAQGDGGGMPSGGPRVAFDFGRAFAANGQARRGRNNADEQSAPGLGLPPGAGAGLPPGQPPSGNAPVGLPFAPGGPPPGAGFPGEATPDYQAKLLAYLDAHRDGSQFLLAVPNSMSASSIIINTGEPVMAMGGFSGGDPILSSTSVADKVAQNTVRYFLLPDRSLGGGGPFAGGPPGPFGGGDASAMQWVESNCSVVPQGDWGGEISASVRGGFGGAQQLYDCGSHVTAG